MAKQVKLAAQTRVGTGRTAVNKVKQAGNVPAVIYGGKETPANLQVAARDIEKLLSHAVGENILVELEIADGGSTSSRLALIQEVQHHPVSRKVLHIDFHAVSQNEAIRAQIPVEPTGEADGVKNFGGILEQSLRSLEVECLPQDLPEVITVDVTKLGVGASIHVKDIVLPAGVSALDDPELTVFLVAAPNVAAEAPGAGAAQPEVLKEKKQEAAG